MLDRIRYKVYGRAWEKRLTHAICHMMYKLKDPQLRERKVEERRREKRNESWKREGVEWSGKGR